MGKIINFVKNETVLVISWVLAFVSMFFVVPDAEYVSYIDMYTLILLFCLMLAMEGFREQGVFSCAGNMLLKRVHTIKQLETVLIFLPFVFSMFITNDVALITFVPLAIEILVMAKAEDRLVFVVAMQTVAANLGSMLLPIGNPQNIYLYSYGGYSLGEFVSVMLPYAVISAIIIALMIAMGRRSEKINIKNSDTAVKNKIKIIMYAVIFTASLCTVAKLLNVYVLLVITLIAVLVLDRAIIKKANYSLLLTFVGFFVFVGNMGRIDAVKSILQSLLEGHEAVVSVILSQAISNVPAALLLSDFTKNCDALLIGVNIGGLGTLIASMASLISYKYVCTEFPKKHRTKYFAYFTKVNILFLVILTSVYFVIR